jgi:hypothetical protein
MTQLPLNFGDQPFDAGDAAVQQPVQPTQRQGPFRPVRKSVNGFQVTTGSLIRFQYTLWKHDPYPMLIVMDRLQDGDIRGVNLRYLTLNYVVLFIRQYCGRAFSYQNLAMHDLAVNSFRRYKSFGMRNIEVLDSEFILKTIDIIRTHDPNQEKAMRESIQKQLQKQMNPTVEDLQLPTKPPVTPVSPISPIRTPEAQRQFDFMSEGGAD